MEGGHGGEVKGDGGGIVYRDKPFGGEK